MYGYEKFNLDKSIKHIKFLKLMGDIFAVMFLFDILRAFFTNNLYAMLNSIVFLILFSYVSIKQEIIESRIDINKSKDKDL